MIDKKQDNGKSGVCVCRGGGGRGGRLIKGEARDQQARVKEFNIIQKGFEQDL